MTDTLIPLIQRLRDCNWWEADCDIRMEAANTIEVMAQALKWFIDNDETNRGGRWEDDNAFWIEGLENGIRAYALYDSVEGNRLLAESLSCKEVENDSQS